MRAAKSYLVSIFFAAGLGSIFLGERILASGPSRGVFTGLGVLLVLLAVGLRALRMSAGQGDVRRSEQLILGLYLLGVLGLAIYFVQSDLMDSLIGGNFSTVYPKLSGTLGALWPVLVAASILPVLLVEYSYSSMAQAPVVEYGRILDAVLSGLGLAGALIFAFALVYVGTQRDAKWDLSYFRTSKPGDATRKIVRALDQPVDASLFFPPANDVRTEVAEYFTDLAKESNQLKVSFYDQAVDLAKAKELGVSGNGAIVLSRGGRKEQMLVGLKLEMARSQLRDLDKEIQKRLLQVSKTQRTVYFTTGHGERSDGQALKDDQRQMISQLKELLRTQNYELRNLSAAEGLANEIPKDAAAVAVIGPTNPFLPQEIDAVTRYLRGGGRMVIALDPEAGQPFKELLAPFGLTFSTTPLANDQVFVRVNNQKSDRGAIGTASYSSHPAVTSLSQLGQRAPVFFIGAGSLEMTTDRPVGANVDFIVHALPSTFNDVNKDFEPNPPAETRKPWELAAAIALSKPDAKPEEQGRAVVFADSDGLADLVMQNPGNRYLALDAMRWVLGEESIAGTTSSEADVPIEHTRKQDVFWFYSTIFLVPALVLGAGFGLTRRRSKARAAAAPVAAPAKETR